MKNDYLEDIIKARNRHENKELRRNVEQFNKNRDSAILSKKLIPICSTPLSLMICGAKDLDIMITPDYLEKLYTTHDLTTNMIEKIADELRCPALLLNGSETNPTAIVAISPLIVPDKGPLLIAVSLEKQESWHIINKISSCYGREHFNPFVNKGTGEWEEGYIRKQIKKGKLIAVNKEKAQHILRPAGLQLPLGESYIGFDNSISHSLDSVKGLDEKIYNKILDNLHKKYSAPTGREKTEEKSMEEIIIPKLADIDEAVGEYKSVEIQEEIAKHMLDLIKDMPPMTKEQHRTLANTCQDFLNNSHKIRAEFTALQGENEKLRTELEATKSELAEARKELSIYKEAMAQGITIDSTKDIDQYAYLVTEVLPENIANIEQKLADNAKTESAIRESDYNFKDLVAMIHSSKAYTEQTLPPEFVAKLEQSIEKLGYVSGETHGKVQTELDGVKTELAGAKIQIAKLTEINEQLKDENRELNVRVVELLDINENLRHIPQKEMTGLSPEIQKLTELTEKPDMAEIPGMLDKIKNIIGGERERNSRGGEER